MEGRRQQKLLVLLIHGRGHGFATAFHSGSVG
jgi:hypothetical protein